MVGAKDSCEGESWKTEGWRLISTDESHIRDRGEFEPCIVSPPPVPGTDNPYRVLNSGEGNGNPPLQKNYPREMTMERVLSNYRRSSEYGTWRK